MTTSAASKADDTRADIRKTTTATLNDLYKTQPSARKAIANSAGYAVFSNFGMKIFLAGGGSGKGMAVNNKTKAETFMKMVEVQAGLGLGVKKFRLVWVFQNKADFDTFVNSGWEIGAQAGATAKTGDKGSGLEGAVSVKPGVYRNRSPTTASPRNSPPGAPGTTRTTTRTSGGCGVSTGCSC
jgi:lipid-binding SYLF domain-containing protein